ncbi:MAG: sigma-70 family RNA polymerase sigma factor [Dehalococcoidia bacterium]|nr:sigma-70 family RNA polymerase sigma factor [Dehalococcoidia bacterium]
MVAESSPGGPEGPHGARASSRRETFEEMYDTYMPKVYRYVSYRTGNASVAEDLTSDVFEKALKHFDSYREEKASQSTWLMTIARNTVTDHFRREGRVQVVREEDAPEEVSEEPNVEEQVARLEEVRQLRLCLAGLPQIDQDIISLKFGAGMNNREIARTLKVSESNVGTRLFRAVRRLRDSFKGWEQNA